MHIHCSKERIRVCGKWSRGWSISFHGFSPLFFCVGKQIGDTVLFFGCRKKNEDYIYEDELSSYSQDGTLAQLHVAFSRDQVGAVWVYIMCEYGYTDGIQAVWLVVANISLVCNISQQSLIYYLTTSRYLYLSWICSGVLFVFSKQISVTSRSVRVKGRKGDVLALPRPLSHALSASKENRSGSGLNLGR